MNALRSDLGYTKIVNARAEEVIIGLDPEMANVTPIYNVSPYPRNGRNVQSHVSTRMKSEGRATSFTE